MSAVKKEPPILKPLWWLWLPAVSFIIFVLLEIFLPTEYYGYYVNENGVLETAHGLIMVVGSVFAFLNLRQINMKEQKFLTFWFGAALLGCVYVAGEEISWGQHIFQWATPEGWLAINDQQETNLHNTTSWLDQKPRLLLEIGVIIGGLVLPAILRKAPQKIPPWLTTITPPDKMAVCALIFLIVKIFDKAAKYTDFILFKRGSEVTEFYMHYFIALYLFAMLHRFKPQK